ncbi:MAG TPA: hypothetical protein DEG43_06395 [Acidimicrobiaceae bacterium]|jgi:hypothetical protein|nr:hypothetical protein [Acidimicrobiaceae bacterium]
MASIFDLTNSSGRLVTATNVEQWRVYAGLIEGLPTQEMNRTKVERAEQEAIERWGGPVILIPPNEQPVPWNSDRPYPFGTPSALPAIGVRAHFTSSEVDPLAMSSLTIVWFQEDWAPPVDASVLAAIRSVEWEARAKVFEI